MQRFHPQPFPTPPPSNSGGYSPLPLSHSQPILCVHVGEAWPAINSRGHPAQLRRDEEEGEEKGEERTSKGWLYYPEGNFVPRPPRDCWVIVVRSVWPMLHLLTRIIVKRRRRKKRNGDKEGVRSVFAWSFRFSSFWNVEEKRTPFFFLLRKGEWRWSWILRECLRTFYLELLGNITRLVWK